MKLNIKQALEEWDKFCKTIQRSTPVNQEETIQEKILRMKALEADDQAWKEYYFPHYFKSKSPQFHKDASRRLFKNFLKFKHWYEVLHWARGLSKTTLTMMNILKLVMTKKLKAVGYISSTYDAAESFLEKYRAELTANQRLINDYGKQERPGSWRAGGFITMQGSKFIALGAGQSPRGESNEEVRMDCWIIDDFDTDEECRNIDIINQKWDWFEKAVFFTVDTSSAYLIIWLGNIIAEDCCVVRAGLIADHCETINIRDASGRSVWPEKNSEEDIDYQISKVSYESSEQELFNNPIRQGVAFREMKFGKCPPISKMSFIVIYADPATSNKDRPAAKSKATNSCKAVAVIGAMGLYRYVYKCFVDSVNNNTFTEWLFAAHQYADGCKLIHLYVENNTLQDPFYQQVLLPLIYAKSREKGDLLPVRPDPRIKPDKYARIEGTLEPINRNGFLILNEAEKEDPHMKRLVSQFKAVRPNSKVMDGPDCVEGGVHIINSKTFIGNSQITTLKKPKNPKRIR